MGKKISIAAVLVVLLAAWLLFGSSQQATNASQASASDQQSGNDKSGGEMVAGGGPKIEFPEDTFDFGNVVQNSSMTHIFKVKNAGDAPLELIKAAAS